MRKFIIFTFFGALAFGENLTQLNFSSLFLNADLIVKIVICILACFSLLSWAIFFSKFSLYFKEQKSLEKDFEIMKNAQNLDDEILSKLSQNEIYRLLKCAKTEVKFNHDESKERIQSALESEISKLINNKKNGISALASIGSSAPFIGLFGTIWGIMHSFIGIANAQNASLAVVAPGIAEALFATAFGLIAAIPAVLFYNFLIRKSINYENLLESVANFIFILSLRK